MEQAQSSELVVCDELVELKRSQQNRLATIHAFPEFISAIGRAKGKGKRLRNELHRFLCFGAYKVFETEEKELREGKCGEDGDGVVGVEGLYRKYQLKRKENNKSLTKVDDEDKKKSRSWITWVNWEGDVDHRCLKSVKEKKKIKFLSFTDI